METTKATKKQTTSKKHLWTPEAKAELRKRMPKKLNKLGEWFFSEAGGKEYIIVHDWKAVMK